MVLLLILEMSWCWGIRTVSVECRMRTARADLYLSSFLLLSWNADVQDSCLGKIQPFDYPDYTPVECAFHPSLQILMKLQPPIHRYELFRVQPTLHWKVGEKVPAGIENMVFQEGIPLRLRKRKDSLQNEVSFQSFVTYEVNGDMVRLTGVSEM